MLKYYSNEALGKIKKAKSYGELLGIARDVLEIIHHQNPLKPIAMLCGPISTGGVGSRKANLAIFCRAIDRISANGLLVFSQMPFEDDMERIYKSDPALQGLILLEQFYLPIFESGLVKLLCFLPGWEKSVGANWEHEQAKRLKIPIIYLSEYYISD